MMTIACKIRIGTILRGTGVSAILMATAVSAQEGNLNSLLPVAETNDGCGGGQKLPAPALSAVASHPKTFCNPLNLDYRIQPGDPLRREAADPVCVLYKGDYYLFASKSGGYWWSPDFSTWTLVIPKRLPLENYAPAVFEYDGALYFMASQAGALSRSTDPKNGDSWTEAGRVRVDTDPTLFKDDDGRVYLYYGCHPGGPIKGVELDPKNRFKEIGSPVELMRSDERSHGWEVQGDYNNNQKQPTPWIEGAWMTKHGGTYYLQYAAPGTGCLTYGDGIYEGTSPLGPFKYALYSPFSLKPTGFMAGAGHSCTFQDAAGKSWHIATGVISVRHPFERRLALSPVWFDKAGRMTANTYRGDLPQFLPGCNPAADKDCASNLAGWNLLTFNKPATASSESPDHGVKLAFDENIKTWWAAASGNPGEWLQVDLGGLKTVRALQVNFAEDNMAVRGRAVPFAQQYTVECSTDGNSWVTLVDKSANRRDVPHDYLELNKPFQTRFLRLVNRAQADAGLGRFAIRDFRVFGTGQGKAPGQPEAPEVSRDAADLRHAVIRWKPVQGAEGYLVSYGVAPDALNTHFEVRGRTELDLRSLNTTAYPVFVVQSFNENGVSTRSEIGK